MNPTNAIFKDPELIQRMSVLALYRTLLKNMKFYPSKNRFQILLATKEEFRDNLNLKDEKRI